MRRLFSLQNEVNALCQEAVVGEPAPVDNRGAVKAIVAMIFGDEAANYIVDNGKKMSDQVISFVGSMSGGSKNLAESTTAPKLDALPGVKPSGTKSDKDIKSAVGGVLNGDVKNKEGVLEYITSKIVAAMKVMKKYLLEAVSADHTITLGWVVVASLFLLCSYKAYVAEAGESPYATIEKEIARLRAESSGKGLVDAAKHLFSIIGGVFVKLVKIVTTSFLAAMLFFMGCFSFLESIRTYYGVEYKRDRKSEKYYNDIIDAKYRSEKKRVEEAARREWDREDDKLENYKKTEVENGEWNKYKEEVYQSNRRYAEHTKKELEQRREKQLDKEIMELERKRADAKKKNASDHH